MSAQRQLHERCPSCGCWDGLHRSACAALPAAQRSPVRQVRPGLEPHVWGPQASARPRRADGWSVGLRLIALCVLVLLPLYLVGLVLFELVVP